MNPSSRLLTLQIRGTVRSWVCGLLVLMMCCLASPAARAEGPGNEHTVKVALTYKLSKFIGWSDAQPEEQSGTFLICVLGAESFARELAALDGRRIDDAKIRVEHFARSAAIDPACKMLFIGESKRAFLGTILEGLKDRGMLTLAEIDGFARQGGMIEFTRGRKRMGFTINLASARHSGITIAAPLLQLSNVIDHGDEG